MQSVRKRRSSADLCPLGRFIRDRLGELGMSQDDLAKAVGTTDKTIRDICYGHNTTATRLTAIAHALKVSPGKLLDLYDGKQADTEQIFGMVYRIIAGELPPDKAGVVSHRIVQELGGSYIF